MNYVSIKLAGGLSNYLFQIACAYAYALDTGKEFILDVDNSVVIHKHISNYKENILTNLSFEQKKISSTFFLNEEGFHFQELQKFDGNVYLNGYWQSEKYFKHHEEKIRKLFSYPQEYVFSIKEKYKHFLDKNTCSIHVRRGDYLKSPNHHPVQSMNYYSKAIKQMPKDSLFLIFSDDIQWCKENFPDVPEKFVFIEGNSDHEDQFLMSLCQNNIICNSTFSWWGAWLNNNKDKKVIAPSKWFGSAYAHYNTNDLYCENWIKI